MNLPITKDVTNKEVEIGISHISFNLYTFKTTLSPNEIKEMLNKLGINHNSWYLE